MNLTVTGGMEEGQIHQPVILVVPIPVMPFEVLLPLDHLVADGTTPVLLAQDLRATWRRRVPRQLSVTVLEVRLPGGIKGVGVALHLDMALRCEGLPNVDDLLTADRIGEPPGFPYLLGEIARGDPAPGVVRVAPSGPPLEPSPDEVVEGGERLATHHLTMIVGPTPQDGVEGRDELCRGTSRGSLAEGFDLGCEGLQTGPARRDLQLGRFVVGPLILASGLPLEVEALRDGGDDGLRRRQPDAPYGEKGVEPWQDRVCEDLPRIGGDDAVIGPPHVIDVVDAALPAAAVHDRFESVQHHIADHRRDDAPLRDASCGRKQGAAVDKAAA
jgi:hypothetical protein